MTTGWRDLGPHKRWLTDEAARLLEFARGAKVEHGFGWLDANGNPDPQFPLQLWITTRMIHVFALGDLMGHPGCGPLADHGLQAIRDTFHDPPVVGTGDVADDPFGDPPGAVEPRSNHLAHGCSLSIGSWTGDAAFQSSTCA